MAAAGDKDDEELQEFRIMLESWICSVMHALRLIERLRTQGDPEAEEEGRARLREKELASAWKM